MYSNRRKDDPRSLELCLLDISPHLLTVAYHHAVSNLAPLPQVHVWAIASEPTGASQYSGSLAMTFRSSSSACACWGGKKSGQRTTGANTLCGCIAKWSEHRYDRTVH